MQGFLLDRFNLHLKDCSDPQHLLRALGSGEALLANPNSSDSVRRVVVDAIGHLLSLREGDILFLRYAVKLLGDVAALHGALAHSVISFLRPLLDDENLSADALSALASVEGFLLDEHLLLSLASSPYISVRSKLVKLLVMSLDGDKRSFVVIQPHVMIHVLLGLAEDVYPLIRTNAMDGLASICRKDDLGFSFQMARRFYDCASSVLRHDDELIRFYAIRLISACGLLFEKNNLDTCSRQFLDAVFIQLCVMARDVNMKVRAETFSALGKVQSVSENLLLQSLSKKMLETRGIKDTVGQLAVINSELPLSSFAGAFMHGIEDEFHEVRLAACKSLGLISILSIQFAASALDLLMDMLNDDAIAIRLLTLEILYQMTTNGRLFVQDKHWEMFLSLLNDASASIRYAMRKLLQLLKLPKLQIFKATINSLLRNLEMHPEEEEDIFFILFCIGIHHAKFGSKVATEYLSKVKASNVGELTLDAPSVSGQLVLAVSSSFSEERKYIDIPSVLFSYAIPLVGRIYRSLGGLICQDLLSSYMCHLSGIHFPFGLPKQKDNELTAIKLERAIANSIKYRDKLCSSCFSHSCDNPKIELGNDMLAQGGFSTSFELNDNKGLVDDRLRGRIRLILEELQETWFLIQGKSVLVVQKMWRLACKKELEVLSLDVSGPGADLIAFALKYIQVLEVVSGIWWQIHAENFEVSGIDVMDILIEKLESSVWGVRYCFLGLEAKEECLLLELLLLGYLLQLKKVGIYVNDILKRIRVVIYRLQLLAGEGSNLSDFFAEAKKYYAEETANEPLQPSLDNLVQLFNLRPVSLCGRLRHIKADLKVLCGSSEIPLHFISGFPIGITFQVVVYNASQLDRTWLQMVVGDSAQYININFSEIEGCNDVRKGTLTLPFYATPKASSFLLKACMLLEFPLGDAFHVKIDAKGPKHGCAQISNDVDVYFAQANRHQ